MVCEGKPYPPQRLEDFQILPGVAEALWSLRRAGFLLIVATNQPDIGRGVQRREVVEAMHRILYRRLPVDDIKVCYDTENSGCTCYKPKPGMLLDAATEYGIDLTGSYMVGDRWRDVGAGKAAGCCTIFIDRHYNEPLLDLPDLVCSDLSEATAYIMERNGHADHGGCDGETHGP